MLNINSPTVQAMMQNVPQGVGNMPVYFGNTPVVSTEQQPISTPYPSPKEMIMQSGQQNVYAQSSFAPRNIVGGYNPGYEAAFGGYVNPYMGYGYSGYNYNQIIPLDEETKLTLALAEANGLDYNEQINMESALYKKLSRIVSKNCNRTEEEAEHFEKYFDVYNKTPRPPEPVYGKAVPQIHVKIKVGDEVVSDIPSPDTGMYYTPPHVFDEIRKRDQNIRDTVARNHIYLYNNAPERSMDNVDMLDFFNNHASSLLMGDIDYAVKLQASTNAFMVYNQTKFQQLLNNNGIKTRAQRNAIDRYVGRYGVMPDGRLVSPAHDPSISSSFSYNEATGSCDIKPPNFMARELDLARERFIRSIG